MRSPDKVLLAALSLPACGTGTDQCIAELLEFRVKQHKRVLICRHPWEAVPKTLVWQFSRRELLTVTLSFDELILS